MNNRKTGTLPSSYPKKVPKQVKQIEVEELTPIDNDQNQNLNKSPSSPQASCHSRADSLSFSLSENKSSCSKWTYMLIFCVLVIFLTVEYVVEIQIKYHNTKRFIQNLNALRDSKILFEANQQKTISSQGSKITQVSRQQHKFNFNGISAQGNKIKFNRPVPHQISSQLAVQNPSSKASAQTVLNSKFEKTPSFSQVTQQNEPMNPLANNQHQERSNDVYNSPTVSSKIDDPNDPNSKQPKINQNNPNPNSPLPFRPHQVQNQPWRQIKVFPTISPWSSVKLPESKNPFSSFAGIFPEVITLASKLKNLVQADTDSLQLNPIALEQKKYYDSKYQISTYKQLPFCIVVPTFNNAAQNRYLNNIKSIIMQDYKNYHIVVIDDHSTDDTGVLIKNYLEGQKKVPAERYKIIRNSQQMRAMVNIRTAAKEHCHPQEIFMIVDGDDELLGRQVLKLFNSVFQEKKLWFVYSNFLTTSGSVGFSRPFPQSIMQRNAYRSYPFVTSHLRAFYTKLLLNIKEQDLKDELGAYLKAANDVAICIPILEQSHERVGYIPELTYYYNSNTGINNHIIRLNEQRGNERKIRSRKTYERLENLLD